MDITVTAGSESTNKKNAKQKTSFRTVKSMISSHGTSQIAHTKTKLARACWTTIFIIFLAFLIIMLESVFSSFISHDIYTVRKKTQVEKMDFPAVSFCPSVKLYDSSYIGDISTTKNVEAAFVNPSGQGERINSVEDEAPTIETMFMKKVRGGCTFSNYSCNFKHDFETVLVSANEGVCYTFNHRGKFVQQGEGSDKGFSALIFINQTEKRSSISNGPGLTLVIQPHDTFPFPLQNGILVSPGEYTSIRLTKRHFSRLPTPYKSKCKNNGYQIYPGKYTTWNCKRSCSLQHAISQCEGADKLMEYNSKGNNTELQLDMNLLCLYKQQADLKRPQNEKTCSCALPCKEDTFLPLITQSAWPSTVDLPYYKQIFADALGKNLSLMSDEYVYKNFLKLNVFFNELAYEDITEVSEWTFEKLLSDIGGQMGIWIGASFFSVLELVAFIFLKLKDGTVILRDKIRFK